MRPVVIVGSALGVLVVAGLALATRYDYVAVEGRLVRVDRWSGKIVTATKKPVDELGLEYLAKRGRAIVLPDDEGSRVSVTGELRVPQPRNPNDLSRPYDDGTRLVLQVKNGSSAYSVEWLDIEYSGDGFAATKEIAFSDAGVGYGPRPGRTDRFTLSMRDGVRTWRVAAIHGFPEKGQP